MFLENKIVDERISRAIDNDHTAAMKLTDKKKRMRKKGCNSLSSENGTTCMICNKSFSDRLMYKKHLRIHSDKYFCQTCGKGFAFKDYLQAHMLSHGKMQQFQCHVCHKNFSQKGNFNQHLKLHASKKSYKCDICKKNFFQEKHFNLHLRLHNNERPFVCEICHKSFNIKSSLQRHMNCHTGAKPFICDICNRGYTRRSVLVLHIEQVHENKKPFQCAECHLCFSQKGNLQAHFRRKHLQPKSENKRNKDNVKNKRIIKKHKKHKAIATKNILSHMDDDSIKLKVIDTSLHNYASKVNTLNHNATRILDSSFDKNHTNNHEQNISKMHVKNEKTVENNEFSKCTADIFPNNGGNSDIPDLDFVNLLENHADTTYDLKSSLADFGALIDDEKAWSNFLEDNDAIFNPSTSNYELNEAFCSPSKSTIFANKISPDENELFPSLDLPLSHDDGCIIPIA